MNGPERALDQLGGPNHVVATKIVVRPWTTNGSSTSSGTSAVGVAEGKVDLEGLAGDLQEAGASRAVARAVGRALTPVAGAWDPAKEGAGRS